MPLFEVDDLSTPDGRWWTAHRVQATMLYSRRSRRAVPIHGGHCGILSPSSGLARSRGGRADGPVDHCQPSIGGGILERHGGAQAAHEHGFDFYRDQIRRSHGRWLMAGNLLTMLLRLTRHQELQHRASINMAAYVLEKEQPFPGVMAANRKDIYEAWSRYKAVAHFCGAFANLYVNAVLAGGN